MLLSIYLQLNTYTRDAHEYHQNEEVELDAIADPCVEKRMEKDDFKTRLRSKCRKL